MKKKQVKKMQEVKQPGAGPSQPQAQSQSQAHGASPGPAPSPVPKPQDISRASPQKKQNTPKSTPPLQKQLQQPIQSQSPGISSNNNQSNIYHPPIPNHQQQQQQQQQYQHNTPQKYTPKRQVYTPKVNQNNTPPAPSNNNSPLPNAQVTPTKQGGNNPSPNPNPPLQSLPTLQTPKKAASPPVDRKPTPNPQMNLSAQSPNPSPSPTKEQNSPNDKNNNESTTAKRDKVVKREWIPKQEAAKRSQQLSTDKGQDDSGAIELSAAPTSPTLKNRSKKSQERLSNTENAHTLINYNLSDHSDALLGQKEKEKQKEIEKASLKNRKSEQKKIAASVKQDVHLLRSKLLFGLSLLIILVLVCWLMVFGPR